MGSKPQSPKFLVSCLSSAPAALGLEIAGSKKGVNSEREMGVLDQVGRQQSGSYKLSY